MVVLDSNLFIYLANGSLSSNAIADTDIAHASISEIETLGYWDIRANELLLLQALFHESDELALTRDVVATAIKLRQSRSMSLGDAIIAATAIVNDYPLWTANMEDFAHIDGLQMHNPLKV
jgi:predicted nucleic acid-binding protein